MDDKTRKVFEQVKRCMQNLVGGSGHLASYHLWKENFEITDTEPTDDGYTAYDFRAQARYESEFTAVQSEKDLDHGVQTVEGRIVLDDSFGLTRDDDGSVRLEPWNCLDPDKLKSRRETSQDEIDDLLQSIEGSDEKE